MIPVNPLLLAEAIASTRLSHPEDCRCLLCRARLGDDDAMEAVDSLADPVDE